MEIRHILLDGAATHVQIEGDELVTIVAGLDPIRSDVGAQPSASEEVESTALGGDWEFRGVRAPHIR